MDYLYNIGDYVNRILINKIKKNNSYISKTFCLSKYNYIVLDRFNDNKMNYYVLINTKNQMILNTSIPENKLTNINNSLNLNDRTDLYLINYNNNNHNHNRLNYVKNNLDAILETSKYIKKNKKKLFKNKKCNIKIDRGCFTINLN